MIKSEVVHCLFKISVNGDGYLPENESVGSDVSELRLLVLDRFLQSANCLVVGYFDWKRILAFVAENQTKEHEGVGVLH